MSTNILNKDLKRRIIEISYKHNLSHLGSCLSAVDIIDEIYSIKKPHEHFILSSGHAGLALYCVLEKYLGLDAEKIFNHHGVHPDRCEECHIDCSSGSLGNGLSIGVGMAIADRTKNVYCLISDGECAEGSIYEALTIAEDNKLDNLRVYLNFNGWGAYRETKARDINSLPFHYLVQKSEFELPFLKGQSAHYYTMKEEDYKQALNILQ